MGPNPCVSTLIKPKPLVLVRMIICFYQVDEPSCSTPKKRPFNLPSITSIEDLQTPSFEELLKCFWDSKSSLKLPNGDVKHLEAAAHSPRDSRLPLTTIN